MNQNQVILEYLKTGKTLTPLQALNKFGCFRLAARVYSLRQDGWPILSERLDVGEDKKVAIYSLVNDKEQWPKDSSYR